MVTVAELNTAAGASLKGFPVKGKLALLLGLDSSNDGQPFARLDLNVELPSIFKNRPGDNAGSLTGLVAVRADQAGVHADTLKIEVANAYLGQLLLKNLCFSYTSGVSSAEPCTPPSADGKPMLPCESGGGNRWDGSAEIELPTASKATVAAWAGSADGQFAYAGAEVSGLGTKLPLATGVYLDKVGIAICVHPAPMKLKGTVGIQFGPSISGGKPAFYIDGGITYTDSRPWLLEAEGRMSFLDRQLAYG